MIAPLPVRLTFTFWYAVILFAVLSTFGWGMYVEVSGHLARERDRVVRAQADGVADTLFSFWEGEWVAQRRSSPPHAFSSPAFSGLVTRWAQQPSRLETDLPLRVLDRKGNLLFETHSFRALALPLTAVAKKNAFIQRTTFETIRFEKQHLRMITRPVVLSGDLLFIVQTVSSMQPMDEVLAGLSRTLFMMVPVIVLMASLMGIFLVGVTLRPVRGIIQKVQQIEVSKLSLRLPEVGTRDEIEQLTQTFNEMLERLERAFRRLRQFSAAMSHELRTPLTVMKGEIEVALRRVRTPHEYQQTLGVHLKAIDELSHIVEELLMLAHSETGEGGVAWNQVDLVEISRKMVASFQSVAASLGVHLVDTLGHNIIWVAGEKRLLERLVANLLENAVKHVPRGGIVTLNVKSVQGEARLSVHDTGPGIPPEEMPALFDRFFSKSTTVFATSPRSTGLGLGLCRWIVEAHRGRIEVESPLGKGATFSVYLPLPKGTVVNA